MRTEPNCPPLRGRRVLVVEDVYLIATLLSDLVEQLGGTVLGPVRSVDEAIDKFASEPIDLALLDVKLEAEDSYVLADGLQASGVPVAFVTGYSQAALAPSYAARFPLVEKPVRLESLDRTVRDLLRPRRRNASRVPR